MQDGSKRASCRFSSACRSYLRTKVHSWYSTFPIVSCQSHDIPSDGPRQSSMLREDTGTAWLPPRAYRRRIRAIVLCCDDTRTMQAHVYRYLHNICGRSTLIYICVSKGHVGRRQGCWIFQPHTASYAYTCCSSAHAFRVFLCGRRSWPYVHSWNDLTECRCLPHRCTANITPKYHLYWRYVYGTWFYRALGCRNEATSSDDCAYVLSSMSHVMDWCVHFRIDWRSSGRGCIMRSLCEKPACAWLDDTLV